MAAAAALAAAVAAWHGPVKADWRAAFVHHHKIGDVGALATGSTVYNAKLSHIFIGCATGKLAAEIHIAMGEQAKTTRLRLEKTLL
ncbi:hypothetical protein [Hymenobacter nivis]|uniref:Uncharacterized protein n=1 Tax=Hymenobacter nivis TaxID=1850093 RepID=A0A502HFD6_9BACT|nr:hypothetical protein [Hymenobacter nivis]TPG72293.1 hypothetical protein EAH73_03425 [Hymenobacter nivis]